MRCSRVARRNPPVRVPWSLVEDDHGGAVERAAIRAARPEDVPAIARVHVDSWRTAYPGIVPDGFLAAMSYEDFEERWRGSFGSTADPRRSYRVAELPSGRIVGFASGGPRLRGYAFGGYDGELYTLYLLAEHRRAGIGRRLFGSVARGLSEAGNRSIIACVLARNPSRRFYEALGGEFLGDQKIEIGGAMLEEVAYGWPDAGTVAALG